MRRTLSGWSGCRNTTNVHHLFEDGVARARNAHQEALRWAVRLHDAEPFRSRLTDAASARRGDLIEACDDFPRSALAGHPAKVVVCIDRFEVLVLN